MKKTTQLGLILVCICFQIPLKAQNPGQNHGGLVVGGEKTNAAGYLLILTGKFPATLAQQEDALKKLSEFADQLSPKEQRQFADYVAPLILTQNASIREKGRYPSINLIATLGRLGANGTEALDALLDVLRRKVGDDEVPEKERKRLHEIAARSIRQILIGVAKEGGTKGVVAEIKRLEKTNGLTNESVAALKGIVETSSADIAGGENLGAVNEAFRILSVGLTPRVRANQPAALPN